MESLTPSERSAVKKCMKHAQTSSIEGTYNWLDSIVTQFQEQHLALLRRNASTDICAFSQYMDPEWVPAKHHRYMLKKLTDHFIYGQNGKLIISMPPGHGKTIYSSILVPAFQFGINPHQRIIAAGHTQDFVQNVISQKVRDLLKSPRYKQIFPNTVISKDTDTRKFFTITPVRGGSAGQYIARGSGVGISGYRSTRTIIDDCYKSMLQAYSASARNKVQQWFYGDLVKRALPGNNIALVCTRWHPDDLIGNLIQKGQKGTGSKYQTVIFSAICDDEQIDPLGRKQGEALWPEYHTIEYLLQQKRNDPAHIWHSLYQSKPLSTSGNIVQQSWLKYYEELPPDNMIRRKFVSFDTASTTSQRADFSVGTAWIQTYDKKFFLTDIVRKRVQFTDLLKMVNDFAQKNEASSILIEDVGAGKVICQTYKNSLYAPVIAIGTQSKGKQFRFDSITPLFESGSILLPKHHQLTSDVVLQLNSFPNGKYDDIVDSLTHALRWARGNMIKRGVRKLTGMD